MAGVEQATAPGAETPDDTPNTAATAPDPSGTAPSLEKTSGRASHRADDDQDDHDGQPGAGSAEKITDKAAHRATDRPDGEAAPGTPGTELEPVSSTPGTDLVPVRAAQGAKPAHSTAPTYRPRHAKRKRGRWPVLVAAGLVLVALAGAGAAFIVTRQDDGAEDVGAPAANRIAPAPANFPPTASGAPSATAPPAAAAAPGTAPCRFNVATDRSPRIVPPGRATRSGPVNVSIGTNRGTITMELDATDAPCTVESFLTLAANNYFTDTACHRLTTTLIFVLQCGDPTATGSGDPGYSFDDENLPAPGGTPYPRGALAMANAGPDTNGSQFFIVYKDSPIDPNYPVFGKVTGGLEIVDQVAGGGAPNNDGQPNSSLVIQSVQIA